MCTCGQWSGATDDTHDLTTSPVLLDLTCETCEHRTFNTDIVLTTYACSCHSYHRCLQGTVHKLVSEHSGQTISALCATQRAKYGGAANVHRPSPGSPLAPASPSSLASPPPKSKSSPQPAPSSSPASSSMPAPAAAAPAPTPAAAAPAPAAAAPLAASVSKKPFETVSRGQLSSCMMGAGGCRGRGAEGTGGTESSSRPCQKMTRGFRAC